MKNTLVFLKLGGSLLGDKRRRLSFRAGAVQRIGTEIARAVEKNNLRLLLAHGGGGFAHYPAKRNHTREGLPGGGGWKGFAETRRGVIEMNRRVLDALARGGLHPVLVPPVACVIARGGKVARWDIRVIQTLLQAGQIPLIHGDAVLDSGQGFTILSTEDLFLHLATRLRPQRVLLASDVEGVCFDIMRGHAPGRSIPRIDRTNIGKVRSALSGGSGTSAVHDVTGGMAAKVERLYALSHRLPGTECRIISGLASGAVEAALRGKCVGTLVEK